MAESEDYKEEPRSGTPLMSENNRPRRSSSRETWSTTQSEKQEALSRVVSSFQTYLDEMEDSYEMTIDGGKFVQELIPRILLPIKLITPKFWKNRGQKRSLRSWWSLCWRILLWCASVTELFASIVGNTSAKHNTDVVVESLEPLYLYIIHCVYTAMIKATVKADGVKQRRHREAAAALHAFRHVETPLTSDHQEEQIALSDDENIDDTDIEDYYASTTHIEDNEEHCDNPMHKSVSGVSSTLPDKEDTDKDLPLQTTASQVRRRKVKKKPRNSVLVKQQDRNAARKFFQESVRSDLDGPFSLMNNRATSVKLQKGDNVEVASSDSASPPSSMKLSTSSDGLTSTMVRAISRFRTMRNQISTRSSSGRFSSGERISSGNAAINTNDDDLEAGRTTNKNYTDAKNIEMTQKKKKLIPMIPEIDNDNDNEPPLAAKMRAVLSEREHTIHTAMLKELVTTKIGSKKSARHELTHLPVANTSAVLTTADEQQKLRASRSALNELVHSTMASKHKRHDITVDNGSTPVLTTTEQFDLDHHHDSTKSTHLASGDSGNKKHHHHHHHHHLSKGSSESTHRRSSTATPALEEHHLPKVESSNAIDKMFEEVSEAELVGRSSNTSCSSAFSDCQEQNDGSDAVLPRLTEWAQLLFEVNSGKKRYLTMRYCALVLAALHVSVAPVCNYASRGERFQWFPGSTDGNTAARAIWCTVFILGRLANFWFALLFFSDLHFCVLEYMFRFHVQRSVSALASRRDLECLCAGTGREPLLRLDLDITSVENGPINLVLWYTLRRFVNILFSIRNRDTDIRVCVAAFFLFSWTAAVLFALLFSHEGPHVLGGSFVLLVTIVLFNTIILVGYVIGIFRFGIKCNEQYTLDASRLLKLQYRIEQQRFFHTTNAADDKRLVDYHSLVATVTRLIQALDYPATLGGVRMTMSTAVGILSILISTIFAVLLEVQS